MVLYTGIYYSYVTTDTDAQCILIRTFGQVLLSGGEVAIILGVSGGILLWELFLGGFKQ